MAGRLTVCAGAGTAEDEVEGAESDGGEVTPYELRPHLQEFDTISLARTL